MKTTHLAKILVPALLFLLLLTGCRADEADSATSVIAEEVPIKQEEADVVLPPAFSLPYLPSTTLDPIDCPDGIQQTVAALIYEGLFALDANFAPQKVLCAAAAYDSATFTHTYTLRSGVLFSDGSALTAGDVASCLRRASVSTRYAARFTDVASISAVGGSVVITLKCANASFDALLDIPISKPSASGFLGTGAYFYGSDAAGACLLPNPHHAGSLPLTRIGLLAARDADAPLYLFSSHEVQLLAADLTGSAPISPTGNISFADADTTVLQYVGFNTRRTLFADPAVRAALSLGIDREHAVSAFLSGHGRAAQFPIHPASALYPSNLETVFSHEAYASALQKAGLAKGYSRRVTLLVNAENSFKCAMAADIAARLSYGDLSVELRKLPWEQYVAALAAGNFDLYYGEVRLTADWNLQRLVGSGGALNYGGYTNPALDLQLTEFAANPAASAAQLCATLQQQAPILPICFKESSVLTQAHVVDALTPTAANPFYQMEKWTVHLSQ